VDRELWDCSQWGLSWFPWLLSPGRRQMREARWYGLKITCEWMLTSWRLIHLMWMLYFYGFINKLPYHTPLPSKVQEFHMNIDLKISLGDNSSEIQWIDSRPNRTKSVKFLNQESSESVILWVNLSFNLVRLVVCESFNHLFSNFWVNQSFRWVNESFRPVLWINISFSRSSHFSRSFCPI